jgi:HSP20 family protein
MKMVQTGRPPRRDVHASGRRLDIFDEFFNSDWLPYVDVSESEMEITVQAELPGLNPSDIDVNVTGNLLTIRGEKRADGEKRDENYLKRERYSGAFQRSVHLPSDVKGEEAQARFRNGILSIKLPKTRIGRARKIEIP